MNDINDIKKLYEKLIDGWNNRNADQMAQLFTESGEQIGFDGSLLTGPDKIIKELSAIFDSHPTPPFISVVQEAHFIGEDSAILRAIVGMVPPDKTELDPDLNAYQTLVAVNRDGEWKVELFQNTPAQYHGRPEMVEEITQELKKHM
ncbi:SgcJ/EcaC family oxidoreductase [Virgibacillus doumboii]|uniref:SgcJ/EcaC family oxidoreductase n=1 Tax=Virgibacillus doumboii TaxID=2697503 RepID=UPI0013E04EB6|nr:SgcJ/EcaC family oxidoreductase [Virgibacillus doumboii]